MDEEYLAEIYEQLDKLYAKEYYAKMAIAWLLSMGLVKYKDTTIEYLSTCKLDDFTYNKALQKAIESYRVDEETKKLYRKMKR